MKKLLILPILFAAALAHGQGVICLSTQCVPSTARVGDTAKIGAILQSDTTLNAVTFTLKSGPNTPVMIAQKPVWTTNLKFQQLALVTNLQPGTYVWQVTGTDVAGGTKSGLDSLIVAPAPAACPPPRTAVSVQITINGQLFTVPLGGAKVTYSDGVTQ